MNDRGDQDGSFIRLGDAVARIAEVVRAKRLSRSAAGRVVDLDAPPPKGPRATVAALRVLAEAGIIDPGTGARLLGRALAVSDPDPCCEDVPDPSGLP